MKKLIESMVKKIRKMRGTDRHEYRDTLNIKKNAMAWLSLDRKCFRRHMMRPGYFATRGIVFPVKNMAGVTEVRGNLRKLFGEWKDELIYVGATYGKEAYIQYTGKKEYRGFDMHIILTCPIEDVPEGIVKPGCGFVEEESKQLVYRCETK